MMPPPQKARRGREAANDDACTVLAQEIHEQAGEADHFHVGVTGQHFLGHLPEHHLPRLLVEGLLDELADRKARLQFVLPALRTMMGRTPVSRPTRRARLTHDLRSPAGRRPRSEPPCE